MNETSEYLIPEQRAGVPPSQEATNAVFQDILANNPDLVAAMGDVAAAFKNGSYQASNEQVAAASVSPYEVATAHEIDSVSIIGKASVEIAAMRANGLQKSDFELAA